jgi:hypothetical protein
MRNYLQKLRNGPHEHKRAFALAVSGTITGLILLVWFSTLGYQYGDKPVAAKEEEGPFTVIGNNVANVFSSVKSDIEAAKDHYTAE